MNFIPVKRRFIVGGLVVLSGGFMALSLWFGTQEISAEALAHRYATAPSKFLLLPNGTTAHYREYLPSGARAYASLLLLHGGSLSLFSWEPWVQRLRSSMHIVTVDLPGQGLTGVTSDRDYSPGALAAFVDVFTRTLGLNERFVVVGHSTGGYVAWRFALAHPERLAGLVLIAPGGTAELGGPQGRIVDLVRKPGGALLFRALLSRERMASALKAIVFDPSLITAEIVDRQWDLNQRPGAFDATVARLRGASFDPAMVARLKEIRLPTLILWGRDDIVFPLSEAEKFTSAIPSARFVVYERCGHWPMEEHPDRSAEELKGFISTL
jgi:pimeloyl-ACP methyl ester carboxylesterase